MNVTTTTLVAVLAAVVLVGVGSVGVAATDGPGAADPDVDEVGPSDGLPEPVPEFVGDLLDTIDGFLSGAIESLGDAVSDGDAGSVGGV